jgi:hypothetical protein
LETKIRWFLFNFFFSLSEPLKLFLTRVVHQWSKLNIGADLTPKRSHFLIFSIFTLALLLCNDVGQHFYWWLLLSL